MWTGRLMLSPLNTPDVFSHLVVGVNTYSAEQFRHKYFELNVQFTNGWVRDLHTIKLEKYANSHLNKGIGSHSGLDLHVYLASVF